MDKIYRERSAGVMRKGNKINMEEFLGTLDSSYIADLDASIEAYDDYFSVADETYNDYKVICGKLEVLHNLGYLDEIELNEMRQTVAEMRISKLEGLEHEENRS